MPGDDQYIGWCGERGWYKPNSIIVASVPLQIKDNPNVTLSFEAKVAIVSQL